MRKSTGMEVRLSYGVHELTDREPPSSNGSSQKRTGSRRDGAHDGPGDGRITVGDIRVYDTYDFVELCREIKITPHVAQLPSDWLALPWMNASRAMQVKPSVSVNAS